MVSREAWPAETIWSTQLCTNRPDLNTTKPGAWAPGVCMLSRGAREDVGAQLCRGLRDRSLIVRSGCLGLWGRSCRRWHLGPGVEWDVPLGPGHLRRSRERCSGRRGSHQELHARNIRDPSKMLEQGPDRQRAPGPCSGGLSSICGASESDAYTIGWRSVGGNLRGAIGEVSSSAATLLHEGGFTDP